MSAWGNVNDRRLDAQDPHDTAHTGLWGTISAIDGDQVLVACPEFDGGAHDFGPVPYMGAAPSAGDRAFLHFDSQARPAYAVAPETITTGGGAPGAWQALGTALAPKWRTPVNTSITDLTDPFCPRYYLDRGRVYLGGVILLDDTIADSHNASIISAGLPSDAQTVRDQHFRITEDVYFSGAGWAGDIGFVTGPPGTSKLALSSHPTDAIAVTKVWIPPK